MQFVEHLISIHGFATLPQMNSDVRFVFNLWFFAFSQVQDHPKIFIWFRQVAGIKEKICIHESPCNYLEQ
jgi:hypothetical protein